jgi:hypothetical protein
MRAARDVIVFSEWAKNVLFIEKQYGSLSPHRSIEGDRLQERMLFLPPGKASSRIRPLGSERHDFSLWVA